MQDLGGAWPALVTAFTAHNAVNVAVLRDLVEHFVGKRVGGLYVCGSTGQGVHMSVAERKLVAENVLGQTRGRVPVIVQVGCLALGDAIDLARHARESGADGISSILPPFYSDCQSLHAYFEAIAASVPDLPFLPYIAGGGIDAVALMRELMRIPNVAGTKYTGPNMYEFRRIVELRGGDWAVFSGMDEQCVFAAMYGSSGNIGSTVNFMPGAYRRIHQCCQNGDLAGALELQIRANEVTAALLSVGFAGGLTEIMRMLGFDCGQPRLPGVSLSAAQREMLHSQLDATGFSELVEM